MGEQQPTPWEQFVTMATEEVLWLLGTMAMISLSLVVGRLITKLTGSGSIDPTILSGNWNEKVNEEIRRREAANGNNKLT